MELLSSPLLGILRVLYKLLSSLPLLIQAILHDDTARVSKILEAYRLLGSALTSFLMAFGYGLLSAGLFLLAFLLPLLVIAFVAGIGLAFVGLLDTTIELGVRALSMGTASLFGMVEVLLRNLPALLTGGAIAYLAIIGGIVLYREGKHLLSRVGDDGSGARRERTRRRSRGRSRSSTTQQSSKYREWSRDDAPNLDSGGSQSSLPPLDVDYHDIEYDEHGQLV